MNDPLLDGYNEDLLSIKNDTLMSYFYKENREKEGNETPISLLKIKPNRLMRTLATSIHGGISTDPIEQAQRRQKYGSNTLIPDDSYRHKAKKDEYSDINLSKQKSWFSYISDHFSDKTWRMLLICSLVLIISAILEDKGTILDIKNSKWIAGVSLLAVVLLTCLIEICIESK